MGGPVREVLLYGPPLDASILRGVLVDRHAEARRLLLVPVFVLGLLGHRSEKFFERGAARDESRGPRRIRGPA